MKHWFLAPLLTSVFVINSFSTVAQCSPASYLANPSTFLSGDWIETSSNASRWWSQVETYRHADSLENLQFAAFGGPEGGQILMVVVAPKQGIANIIESEILSEDLYDYLLTITGIDPSTKYIVESTEGPCDLTTYAGFASDPWGQDFSIISCRLATPPYATLIVASRGEVGQAGRVMGQMLRTAESQDCLINWEVDATPEATP